MNLKELNLFECEYLIGGAVVVEKKGINFYPDQIVNNNYTDQLKYDRLSERERAKFALKYHDSKITDEDLESLFNAMAKAEDFEETSSEFKGVTKTSILKKEKDGYVIYDNITKQTIGEKRTKDEIETQLYNTLNGFDNKMIDNNLHAMKISYIVVSSFLGIIALGILGVAFRGVYERITSKNASEKTEGCGVAINGTAIAAIIAGISVPLLYNTFQTLINYENNNNWEEDKNS